MAEQTGRLPPLRNARKRELESTFRDSDWPSFNNAVYALSLLLSPSDISLSLPPSQTAEQPNQSCKVNIKVLLWKVTGSHRTADCWTPARGWFTLMTTVVQSWISVFSGKFIPILSHSPTSNLRDLHIFLLFDKQLPPRLSAASFSPFIFLASAPFLGDGLVEMEKPACRLI